MSAVVRARTVSCTRSEAMSVDITSRCSADTSTPMNSAACVRATCVAASVPSSRLEALARAPEKYKASVPCGTFTIQAGCLGLDAVRITAGASAAQPMARTTKSASARTGGLGRRGLLGQALRLVLQPLDVVELAQHVLVVRQAVGLLHGGVRALVVARVLVGEAQVPIAPGQLIALDLRVLLAVRDRLREGGLRLLPFAALGPADAALELRDV